MTRAWAALIAAALAGCAGSAAPQGAPGSPDRNGDEAVRLLQELIRIDTINPPQPGSGRRNANETALLEHVQKVLAADGIESEIYEAAPGRGNLVARYRGTGKKKPLLLMAHVDVVNVDPAHWRKDPLSGEIDGDFLWGRGALDDKDDAAVYAQVLRMLGRRKPRLDRDVILMLNGDEESSARYGAAWMAERHWDKIQCGLILNEGGSTALAGGKVVQFGFETAEKIYNDFRLWIRGESGHSSVPLTRNAIYDAAEILVKLREFRTPLRLTETTRASFKGLARVPAYARYAERMRRAADGDPGAAEELSRLPRFNAQLRSTFIPTIVRGGIRENVLPPDVEINFNARLLPGDKIDVLIKALMDHLEIRSYALVEGDEKRIAAWKREHPRENVAVFLVDRGVDAPPTAVDTEEFRALERASLRMAPGAIVVPRMSTGATDMRFFRLKGVPCYGVNPCPVGEAEQRTPHHHNERVRVSSVRWGVRYAWELVMELCR